MSEKTDDQNATIGDVKKIISESCEKKCKVFTLWLEQLSSHAMSLEAVQTTCISMMEVCTQAIIRIHELEKMMDEHKAFLQKQDFDSKFPMAITGDGSSD